MYAGTAQHKYTKFTKVHQTMKKKIVIWYGRFTYQIILFVSTSKEQNCKED